MKKYLPVIFLLVLIGLFFKDFIIKGKIPIPADTIVGMYHPWRDYYSNDYPRGIPFKNSLITDPVRQQYPWKMLVIESWKRGQIPWWNPYTFSGTPLLANFQSGAFYPLNLIFLITSFNQGWGIYIFLGFLLSGLFMYLYLRNLNLQSYPSLIGALSFTFSGVFIAWGWWGNITHTLLWLPLILLSIDKIITHFNAQSVMRNMLMKWSILFVFSLSFSFFAGHLQVFFYVALVTIVYLLVRLYQNKASLKLILLVTCYLLLVTFITSIQWIPTLKFILQSARNIDQGNWKQQGWFIPWQNLIQFIAPDFFGNPATLNYWGVWNYGEFIGYIGILPLILVLFALFFRRDKKVLFFGSLFLISLLFALPTFLAKLPYVFKIPLLSTSQPTRLLIVTDFTLAVLAALGMDHLLKTRKVKDIIKVIGLFTVLYGLLWIFVVIANRGSGTNEWANNLPVMRRNLILPTVIFITSSVVLLIVGLKNKKIEKFLALSFSFLVIFDLFRFGWKFLPFTREEWIFPKTKTIEFLQQKQKEGSFRIMSTDERIFPPNFSIVYKIESIDGYDPLYFKSYANLINKMEERELNSSFNRIITPKKYESSIADSLNVKYVLSLTDIASPKLKKIFQEGETRIYEKIH